MGYPSSEESMSQVTIGRWGKNLAVRLPGEVVRAIGVTDGERVEIEAKGHDIVIRRAEAQARADALAAAEEIIAEAEHYSLGEISIRELIDDGRR
jgi:antitoxin component of MazEF toxin-antitoxin module